MFAILPSYVISVLSLHTYSDEEVALEVPEDADWDAETQQLMKSYWKTEFCPVASQLLDRIEHHHSDLIPIDSPSNVAMSSS